ncbi:MAG TPA: DUF5818 domain-containing protein [Thermoanaerobaculia bacterium]|jgi:hypothetical protein|nr:DUF5818 domain-containing protein [Thermoanaerobaculia bacterium]
MNKKTTVLLLTLLALTMLALPLAAAGTKGSWTGWITDESCGAKGAKAEHKACAEKCIAKGQKLVFYNNADKKLYSLDNQDVAKANLGHEVKVTGEADGTAIKVEAIAPAAKAGA